ncbi:hypothetical protein EW146_g3002 [Bondarzewia mesenterica]|uniref:Uncharacterized protein n=2 Tax=Bondarzewia mesenterica TaxID=1095465 RepID=A0A4S4LYW8_9AGAM|nr:hypothetical protein EW146_g3002 [Bondarzewia mesenterica]
MIPAQPPSKRKASEDPNPLTNAAKKARKDNVALNKRKLLNGEEQPGGLVIIRAPPSRPPSSQNLNPPSSTTPPSDSVPLHATTHTRITTSKPPSKKFKTSSGTSDLVPRPSGKGKERDLRASAHPEPDVDEDVRVMEFEANDLRRQSRVQEEGTFLPSNSELQFGSPSSKGKNKSRHRDISLPLAPRETPQIEKNRSLRQGLLQPSQQSHSGQRRKSSLSMRGKRTSSNFESTGVISEHIPSWLAEGEEADGGGLGIGRAAHPHSSVGNSSLYKHIDCDLPESDRARQLLIWLASREISPLHDQGAEASSSKHRPKRSGKDPPPLPEGGQAVLKSVMEDVIKMLAERQVETNAYSPKSSETGGGKKVENEQNAKNRAREVTFMAELARLKHEEEEWAETTQFYNSYHAAGLADLEKRAQSRRAKGKQRADEDWEEWAPAESELPVKFRGNSGFGLACSILKKDLGEKSFATLQSDRLPYKVDRLHGIVDTSARMTSTSETELDRRFALLSIALHAHSQPTPHPALNGTSLSSYLPANLARPTAKLDPQDIFRSLSRIDMSRPPAQVGDAARRAVREVRRAHDAVESGGLTERRLTGVPPPTPRKPPGTPRRATTPGRGR